jgi:hypothetical protein
LSPFEKQFLQTYRDQAQRLKEFTENFNKDIEHISPPPIVKSLKSEKGFEEENLRLNLSPPTFKVEQLGSNRDLEDAIISKASSDSTSEYGDHTGAMSNAGFQKDINKALRPAQSMLLSPSFGKSASNLSTKVVKG